MGLWIVLTIWVLPALMAGSAVALVISATSLVEENLTHLPASLCGAIFFGVWGAYILNALTSNSPEDRINKPLRHKVSPFTRRVGSIAAGGFLLISAGCFISEMQSQADLACACVLTLFALGYWDRPPFRWAKSVPYLKSFWVAGAWTYGAMYMGPHFAMNPIPTLTHLSDGENLVKVGSVLFLWLLLDTFLLDWKDKIGDRFFGIKTLPQILSGSRGATFILTGAIVLTLISGMLNLPPLVQRTLVATGLGAVLFWSLAIAKSSHANSGTQQPKNSLHPPHEFSDEFYFGCATMVWRYILYAAVLNFFAP